MIKSLKQVPLFAQSYLSAYPNASLLQLTQTINGNEYRFRKNSAYFEQSAKLLVEEGVKIIQIDEPILSEVVFTNEKADNSFY